MVYSFMIFLLLKPFKIKSIFSEVYKSYVYAMIPYLIISGLVPFIMGSLSIIYSYILLIWGIAALHFVPKRKVIIPCLIPIVLVIGFLIVAFFVILRNFSM